MQRPRLPAGTGKKTSIIIESDRLPESFDGFKIAHISDPHSRPAKGVLKIISAEKPDIAVITGDLLHDDGKPADEITALLEGIIRVCPVYFVSGNHDLWREDGQKIFSELQRTGAIYMDEGAEEIVRGSEKITLYGVGDPYSKNPLEISDYLKKSKPQPADGYNILLFHRANLFDEIKDWGFDLILSGHMHGGQVRLPYFGGVLPPSSALGSGKRVFFPEYTQGVVVDSSTMVVNRGIGNTLPIPRLGNPPEVGIITLVRSN